ncbi:hypothetical protein OE88DRAFT_1711244 [Heliocybe sulcata]|uniref:Beta/gamma crystallin 'Greek key' domain-containing protein n=1 Tax=Heliocybe sulcata TaxID=5364 RepID=A0A5C3NL83_9AGAM|nr:hypothetical protein OE88DRAFT_1711244 [Heliocybe sulcata]
MGRYGNGASVEDVAVNMFMHCCLEAILSLHDLFMRPVREKEKEAEKRWVEDETGCHEGLWKEGWVMYDGMIVVLYQKPGLSGYAYYTQKSNYGLNVQIGNTPSSLRIINYAVIAWTDSAYALNMCTMPVHKELASLLPDNILFDKAVAHIRIRSEHCMGALKSHWQSLCGLRNAINSKTEHGAQYMPHYIQQNDLCEEHKDEQEDPELILGVPRTNQRQLINELKASRAED